jgi:hypothetical protein
VDSNSATVVCLTQIRAPIWEALLRLADLWKILISSEIRTLSCCIQQVPEAMLAKLILINRYFYPDESATSQMASSLAFDLSSTTRPPSPTRRRAIKPMTFEFTAFGPRGSAGGICLVARLTISLSI